jgi:hypothetical protein
MATRKTAPPTSALFNWLSTLGAVMIVIGIAGAVLLLVAEFLLRSPPAYLGVLFLPLLLLIALGAVLVPVGYVLAKRKQARGETLRLPLRISIDLTEPRHRYVLLAALLAGMAAMVVGVVGSFQAFQVMESNAFCGQACHSVMSPEFTAHQVTPHARVKCVECHIGSGVGWYLHSKLSGTRRMWKLVSGTYSPPQPPPQADKGPGRETCEECHWSSRMIGYKEKVRVYFTSGEFSPESRMRMLIKIGGGDSAFMKGFGIHYHMQAANKVEYAARDPQRQEIAWVKVTRADGSSTEYTHEEFGSDAAELKAMPKRRMDCLDCHNRPAHEFRSPVDAVDQALASGRLPRSLPHIKVRAVKALDGRYETTPEARLGIAASLTDFYKEEKPEVLVKQADLLKKAIAELQGIYETAFFPEMKAKWSSYPDNIGHRDWPGCFRCHNTLMKSAQGKTVFTDCSKCHLILAQGKDVEGGAPVNFTKGKAFDHPGYGDKITEYSKCMDCHTGGADLY